MKKIYIIVIIAAFVSTSFAQRIASGSVKIENSGVFTSKTPNDTLVPASVATGTPTLYNAQGGGYVCGPNSYGDVAKVQEFKTTTSYNVEGMVVWIGAKKQTGTAGTVKFQIWDFDGTGTGTGGTVPAPNTVLGTVSRTFDLVDTGLSMGTGLNFIMFSTPVSVSSDYGIGLEFSSLGNDTLGIVSTTDLDAGATELTWDKWSDGSWHSFLETGNWSLDFDMFIFAIVDTTVGSINDNYFINGIKLSQNQPNPVNNTTLVQYEIENNANVSLEIYDVTGRMILNVDEGYQLSGIHNIQIDADKLSGGTYYYSLKAGNNRLTKSMTISK